MDLGHRGQFNVDGLEGIGCSWVGFIGSILIGCRVGGNGFRGTKEQVIGGVVEEMSGIHFGLCAHQFLLEIRQQMVERDVFERVSILVLLTPRYVRSDVPFKSTIQ